MRPHGAPHGRKMTSKFRVGSLPEEQPSQRRVCLPTQTGRSPHARYPQGRRRGLWLRTSQRGLNPPRSREGSPSPPWGVPPPPPTPWTWGIPPGAPKVGPRGHLPCSQGAPREGGIPRYSPEQPSLQGTARWGPPRTIACADGGRPGWCGGDGDHVSRRASRWLPGMRRRRETSRPSSISTATLMYGRHGIPREWCAGLHLVP